MLSCAWIIVLSIIVLVVIGVIVIRWRLIQKYAKPVAIWESVNEACFQDYSRPNAPLTRFRVLPGCNSVENETAPEDMEQDDEGRVSLSLIIPAFNEENRLPDTLEVYGAHLESRASQNASFTYEIIVVDDGSLTRGTVEVAEEYARQHSAPGREVRVLQLARNRGKGGAVKRGVLCARGDILLFADADGATAAEDISLMYDEMIEKHLDSAVAVGTRPLRQDEGRKLLSKGFRLLVNVLCVRGVRDTQCGFKMFTRRAAEQLFPLLHVERWAFDVEVLFLAQSLGIPIIQREVNWHDVAGSTLNPIHATVSMAFDLVRIRALYALGVWKIQEKKVQ